MLNFLQPALELLDLNEYWHHLGVVHQALDDQLRHETALASRWGGSDEDARGIVRLRMIETPLVALLKPTAERVHAVHLAQVGG